MSTPYSRTKVQAVTATAANIVLSGKATELILSSTTDCWINFNGTAVVNEGFYLPADSPIKIDLSMSNQISVIRDSADGYLSIMEMANSALFNRVMGWFTSNASLLKVGSTQISGNSNLKRIVSATVTGDSNLLKEFVSDSFTGDASLTRTLSTVVTGDSNLLKTISITATGDSNLEKTVEATATADSNLKKTLSSTITSDSLLSV